MSMSVGGQDPAEVDHRVEVGCLDQVVAADLFGGFGERPIGDGQLAVDGAQRRGHRAVAEGLAAEYLDVGALLACRGELAVPGHLGSLLLGGQRIPRSGRAILAGQQNEVLHGDPPGSVVDDGRRHHHDAWGPAKSTAIAKSPPVIAGP
jgi:hypothetical protein